MSRGGFWYTTDDVVGYTNDTHIFKYTATTKVVGLAIGVVIKLLAGASRPCKEEVKTENAKVVWSSTTLLPLAFDKCSTCCGCRLRTRRAAIRDAGTSPGVVVWLPSGSENRFRPAKGININMSRHALMPQVGSWTSLEVRSQLATPFPCYAGTSL